MYPPHIKGLGVAAPTGPSAADVYEDLRKRYAAAAAQWSALESQYPTVRGACQVDKRPDYCRELAAERDRLIGLIRSNCALLAADPTAKAKLYDLLNAANADLQKFCGTTAGFVSAQVLAGLGAETDLYADLRNRYQAANDALLAAQAANPSLVGQACSRAEDKLDLPKEDTGSKFPWWLILLGVAGYYYATKKP